MPLLSVSLWPQQTQGELRAQWVLLAGGAKPGYRLLQDSVRHTKNVGKAARLCFSLAMGAGAWG